MKHIKRGRGPSFMNGVSGVGAVVFGILWTILASEAGPIFALMGVVWTLTALAGTIHSFKNARRSDRYSEYDIVDSNEEPDPWNKKFDEDGMASLEDSLYCPYCGEKVRRDFVFCPKCGKKLPK